jgi:hypothetical protein
MKGKKQPSDLGTSPQVAPLQTMTLGETGLTLQIAGHESKQAIAFSIDIIALAWHLGYNPA